MAQWYLTTVLGKARIMPYSPDTDFRSFESKLLPGTVAFFTPDQILMFPDGWFDLCQTISTLPEMPSHQSSHYLELLAAKSRYAIFLKQWRRWHNVADDVELREEDYGFSAPWASRGTTNRSYSASVLQPALASSSQHRITNGIPPSYRERLEARR